MRGAGFAAKDNSDDETLLQFGRLFFDSDEESERQGYRIPQNLISHRFSLCWSHESDVSRNGQRHWVGTDLYGKALVQTRKESCY